MITKPKSSFANEIAADIIDLNPSENIIILNFSLEMVGFRQVGRTLSNKLKKTTSELYSSEKNLDDKTFDKVVTVANQLKKYPIYFVDNPGTSKQVEETIMAFYNKYVKGTNKHFIIMYDHALLTKREGTVIETISNLLQVFIQVKKLPLTSVIVLTQMNRNIEQPERINNPDYVLALHRPELLGIQEYGPNKLPTSHKVFMHILKNRDAGEPCIIEFENDLRYNNLIEI